MNAVDMKCIAYISRVTENGYGVPTSLSEIYRSAQKKNNQYQITGILSFKRGYFIQVIEGDNKQVDQLYSNILKDSRHRNILQILNTPIKERSFPQWGMKLASLDRNRNFYRFYEHYLSRDALSSEQRDILGVVYKHGQTPTLNQDQLSSAELSLTAWPDFTNINPSPSLISLCARLVANSGRYNDLATSREFGDEKELLDNIKLLNDKGVLVMSARLDTKSQTSKVTSNDSFMRKMKKFLGLASNGV